MSILIVAEHDSAAPLDGFYNAVAAAVQLGDDIVVLVAGDNCKAAAQKIAVVKNIRRVFLAQHSAFKNGLAENIAPLIAKLAVSKTHIIMAAGSTSRSWLPRAAALCDCQMISDVIAVESADTFVRPIYAGNGLATVQSCDAIKFLSIRATTFAAATSDAVAGDNESAATIEEVEVGDAFPAGELSTFLGEKISEQKRPELTSAKVVVSGGRGVGSAENFRILEPLADKLNAAIGASRAAVDAGFVSNDFQVGQTGKIVAPDIYFAIGISGAIQHLAGIKDSKCIVAINKDPDAPIFDAADVGIVGDLFEIVPALTAALDN